MKFFKPRDYQEELSTRASEVLQRLKIVALVFEVRTGKTITSFLTADKSGAKSVLFITKKKVILSDTILNDYKLVNPSFELTQINYESVHKVKDEDFDLVILDESHNLGAFPKPSKRTKQIKEIVGGKKLILLSGTITPESFSQIYHQFWISSNTPFVEKSFYKWAKTYVDVTKKKINGFDVNDYSNANEKLIREKLSKYFISFTQKQAGFSSKVIEHTLKVKMNPSTYNLVKQLEKDKVVQGAKGGVILADTPVKMLQKVHQIYSGTIKLEDGTAITIDKSKAIFIKERFKGLKVGIFYKYKQELKLLQEVYGESLTTDLKEFNQTDKNIALQIVSGREGISLKKADNLVYINIDYSANSYWQSRDRMTTKERNVNEVYWIFSEGGIEEKIYKKVLEKKSFTTKHYAESKNTKQLHSNRENTLFGVVRETQH